MGGSRVKELQIAGNMIALARNRKGQNKRSAMLRMIMPMLSRETGDKLADAIAKKSSKHFAQIWDHIKHEIKGKLDHQHSATASSEPSYADVSTFQRDGETAVCITTFGPRKIRVAMNGTTVLETQANVPDRDLPSNNNCGGVPAPEPNPGIGTECPADPVAEPDTPKECGTVSEPTATIQIDGGQCGNNYLITGDQMCAVIKQVCERLLMDADPCPLPPSNCCTKHDWPDCAVCKWTVDVPGFDFNANILELYDVLTAANRQL
jgi:hypothetical protein